MGVVCGGAVAFAAVLLAAAAASPAGRTTIPTFTTGTTNPIQSALYDPLFQGSDKTTAFALTKSAGAGSVRILLSWASVAPTTLPGSWDPTNPNSPYYHWSALDAQVSGAQSAGLSPILDVTKPPSWGYSTAPGAWTGGSPKLDALGAFATALAKRYHGSVHAYAVWNEPNFNRNLYPQSPSFYRSMVNAVADSVHAVDPSALVLAGELAPFKHAATSTDKNNVIPPMTFMEQMLCVASAASTSRTCSAKSDFDVWSHHPYSDTGPYGHAKTTGGVEIGDLPKMGALLKTATKLGAISGYSSSHQPQFWVTEFGWSSKPPNTKAVPMGLETRWVAESYYQMWKSGVTLGTWFALQDSPYPSTPFQSGLYFDSATLATAKSKPLLTPFSFPFVAYLKSGGKVSVWGRDHTSNQQDVTIQMKKGSNPWKTVATIKANSNGIFQALFSAGATSTCKLRASANGSGTSAIFSLAIPTNENMNVVPFPLVG